MSDHHIQPRHLLAGLSIATVLVASACGDDGGSGLVGGGQAGDESGPAAGGEQTGEQLSSPDSIIQVVEDNGTGWAQENGSGATDHVDYGFIIENVSDQVAVSVRVEVEFLDEAGDPYEEIQAGGADFSVVLPGQQLGAGGSERLDDGVAYEDIAEMDVRVTLISALDTMDGQHHAESAYQQLEVAEPTPDPDRGGSDQEWVDVQVTNTYDVPIQPMTYYVHRDADGTIVGGGRSPQSMDEIPPGGTGTGSAVRDLAAPRLQDATTEVYVDPQLGWLVGLDPVWQDTSFGG